MFRGRAQAVGFTPKPGERFEFFANVTLYEPRGDYQLQVETMRRAGLGDLHEAFLLLKEKLSAEGLFDPARKRPVKAMPSAVGVVTSLAAAALRDVLTALARRAPHVSVIVYPAPVQGLDAAGKLTQSLQNAVARNEVDTLLIVRGGGSLEDLWSFNDEKLARAIASSPIPIISGVGHETDFTIADFVADVRAPTPTAAAELACRSRQMCMGQLRSAVAALSGQQIRALERASLRLDRAVGMLVSPQQRLRQQSEKLQALKARLARAASSPNERRAGQLALLRARLAHAVPELVGVRGRLERQKQHLCAAGQRAMDQRRQRLYSALQTLQALSPRNILARGYAIVRDEHGAIIKNALDLSVGDQLEVELDRGRLQVNVLQAHALL
jgi:exodeoxyribonuclease VII large subunit